jgi:hypothetical protein
VDNSNNIKQQKPSNRPINRILGSRRAIVALAAIVALLVLGLVNKIDTSMAIAAVAASLAGSNAWQKVTEPRGAP